VNLTAKSVAALVLPGDKDDVIHFDDALPGFGFRLRRRSSDAPIKRTWIAQYRRGGATRRVKLGEGGVLTAETARLAARKLLAAVALGQDPQADRADRRAKDGFTLRGVVDEYLAAKQPEVRAGTFVGIRRYLTAGYFRPLHAMAIDTITRKDIAARLVAITRENGTVTAARARVAINTFFVWAMQMGLVEHNPVVGTIQPKDSEGRTRVLIDAELAAVWRASDEYGEFGRIVRLLVLTGSRRVEVGGLRWSELDREAGTWTLPAARSKNGRAHTLPLPPAAWQIIDAVPRRVGRDHLFGLHAAKGFTTWWLGKAELDRRLGDSVAPFTLHDIRRTVATRMADLGVQPHVIEAVLNHYSGHRRGVAGIYNRSSYEREVKAALALWADHIHARAEGNERKVVAFSPLAAS
jgi:integrase